MISKRHFTQFLGAAAAATVLPRAARAQAKGSAPELAAYTGADHPQRLVDGAKKEGPLSIYTSAQSDDMGALVARPCAKAAGMASEAAAPPMSCVN